MSSIEQNPPVLMILGPTASGKSAAAMALAQRRAIEIISVDSAQVYRDLNIGTAKPSEAERAAVPHHLIDIIDPDDRYSAARFVDDASNLIEQIRSRNCEPVIVGGTMLYVKALVDGLHALPQADAELRAKLETDAAAKGWPAMHAKLATLDPETAQRLRPTDSQRIQRALEICLISGQPMSAWIAKPKPELSDRPNAYRLIALEPSTRDTTSVSPSGSTISVVASITTGCCSRTVASNGSNATGSTFSTLSVTIVSTGGFTPSDAETVIV